MKNCIMNLMASNDKQALLSLALSQVIRAGQFEIADDLNDYTIPQLVEVLTNLNKPSKAQVDFYNNLLQEAMVVSVEVFEPITGFEYRMAIDEIQRAFQKMPPTDFQIDALECRGLPIPKTYWAAREAVRQAQKDEYRALPPTQAMLEYAKDLCTNLGLKWSAKYTKMNKVQLQAQIRTWRSEMQDEPATADQIERLCKLYAVSHGMKYSLAVTAIAGMSLTYGTASAMIKELTPTDEDDTRRRRDGQAADDEARRWNANR